MSKSFKQVSTGLTLVCDRKDVIAQYEKYPEQYIPLEGKKNAKPTTEKKVEKRLDTTKSQKTETEDKAKS